MALAKLLNINPTINTDIVSLNLLETNKTRSKTDKLPKQEARIIPNDESKISDKKDGKIPAPKITKATPKLEPELNPKT